MFSLRQIRGPLAVAVLCTVPAFAAPPLTWIQDTLYKADGSKFSGSATIAWKSFTASDNSNIPTNSLTVQIVDGVLRMQLAPTTNASSNAYYTVRFSADGKIQFTETWAVPPSVIPVGLKEIRIAAPAPAGGGGGTPVTPGSVLMSDIVGLAEALNDRPIKGSTYSANRIAFIDGMGRLSGVTGTTTDCVKVDGTSGACGTGGQAVGFVDLEPPSGALNGSNAIFTLSQAPFPAASLHLFRNGILQRAQTDYTLNGNTVTFLNVSIPQSGDLLLASYRLKP